MWVNILQCTPPHPQQQRLVQPKMSIVPRLGNPVAHPETQTYVHTCSCHGQTQRSFCLSSSLNSAHARPGTSLILKISIFQQFRQTFTGQPITKLTLSYPFFHLQSIAKSHFTNEVTGQGHRLAEWWGRDARLAVWLQNSGCHLSSLLLSHMLCELQKSYLCPGEEKAKCPTSWKQPLLDSHLSRWPSLQAYSSWDCCMFLLVRID